MILEEGWISKIITWVESGFGVPNPSLICILIVAATNVYQFCEHMLRTPALLWSILHFLSSDYRLVNIGEFANSKIQASII